MRVLVTGATGVVGRRVIPLLVSAGHQVTGLARTEAKRRALERTGATAVAADIFSPSSVRGVLAGHHAILNLATHVPRSNLRLFLRSGWRENDRVRSVASSVLVDAAIATGVGRFVQESFAPVYPDCGDEWIDETTPLRPAAYNRSILDAERSAERFAGTGRAAVILRFGAFYGPDARHVPDLIRAVKKGWAPMPGPPDAFLSSISHDDAASAVVTSLALPPGTYNVTDDEPMRRQEFFDSLARTVGAPPPRLLPAWLAYFMGALGETLARSLRISNRRLRAGADWAPRYPSVREGWPAVVRELLPLTPADTRPDVARSEKGG